MANNRGVFYCPAARADSAWDTNVNKTLGGTGPDNKFDPFGIPVPSRFSLAYNDWGLNLTARPQWSNPEGDVVVYAQPQVNQLPCEQGQPCPPPPQPCGGPNQPPCGPPCQQEQPPPCSMQQPQTLDVTAVYTSNGRDRQGFSQEVANVTPQQIPPPPPVPPGP